MQLRSDIHAQVEAVVKIFLDTYGEDRAGDSKLMMKLCNHAACFGMVASVDGLPAGFILLQQAGDSADIIEICVRPSAQNRGIGRQLLDEGLLRAEQHGIERVTLDVAVTNQTALKLYRSAGFTLVGKRPDYYRSGAGKIDALVMARQIG